MSDLDKCGLLCLGWDCRGPQTGGQPSFVSASVILNLTLHGQESINLFQIFNIPKRPRHFPQVLP